VRLRRGLPRERLRRSSIESLKAAKARRPCALPPQHRRLRLRALPPQRRRPQISARADAGPTAKARSPPATASTATDQCRERRLRAPPPQRRRPQISANGDGSEPSSHRVDGHRSAPTATAPSPPATASTATDQRRRRQLGALSAATATAPSPPAKAPTATLPPQISAGADGDGSEPSRHSVDSDEPSLGLLQRCHVMQRSSLSTTTVSTATCPPRPLEVAWNCAAEKLFAFSRFCSPAAIAVLIALHLLREVLPTIHSVHVRWFLDLETRGSLRQVGSDTFVHGLEIRIHYT
jgi:hypothetical protein